MPSAKKFEKLLNADLPSRIIKALKDAGGETRFVGGVVRDILAGEKGLSDIDMATTLLPDKAMDVFKEAGLKVVATGIEHGSIMVIKDDETVHLTTLRKDIKTDGRHAEVRFGEDWLEDAKRRDFTMNAIYLSADGELYDPFNGEADLAKGILKFVGEPSSRIKEDYLRMLRYFRFWGRFSKKDSQEAMVAIKNLANHLSYISGERIKQELWGILQQCSPKVLYKIVETGIDKQIVPSGFNLESAKKIFALGDEISILAKLAIIIKYDEAEELASKLKLSRHDKDILVFISEPLTDDLTSNTWKQSAYYLHQNKITSSDIAERYAINQARKSKPIKNFHGIKTWQKPNFVIKGKDIQARGIESGKEIGEILAKLEKAWVQSNFKLKRKELLKMLDDLTSKD